MKWNFEGKNKSRAEMCGQDHLWKVKCFEHGIHAKWVGKIAFWGS